jgi:hypothetical protein
VITGTVREADNVWGPVFLQDEYGIRNSNLEPEDIVVDVGAHIGCRSRRKTGPFWRVEWGRHGGYALASAGLKNRPGRPVAFYFDTFFAASASAAC